jgi:phosphoribosylamine---glycine ligase
VGSWAKEHILIEKLKTNPSLKVYSYLDTKNPGIINLVDGYKLASLSDVKTLTKYAKELKTDLVLITTAFPLSNGAVDLLEKEGIRVFGPNSSAAKLESDKSFSRELMKKNQMDYALPKFAVFYELDQAITFAKSLDYLVAVKPLGLTEGLGVKVFGDQLKNTEDVCKYIEENIKEGLIIEEKMIGEEFSIQCFVNNDVLLTTPVVKDFKKLLEDDKGDNTASMGSYSMKNGLLPFLDKEQYLKAVDIIKNTVDVFRKETKKDCLGFLYGQFMLTKNGLKVIEYNFRPGDPEWLNIVPKLEDDILDIINNVSNGNSMDLKFKQLANVCKYIVPNGYPALKDQILDISFDKKELEDLGVKVYYSCGYDDKNRLNVGTERGIALLAEGENVLEASNRLNKAITLIKGEFHYREDIGSSC